jgi:hypothetical protein
VGHFITKTGNQAGTPPGGVGGGAPDIFVLFVLDEFEIITFSIILLFENQILFLLSGMNNLNIRVLDELQPRLAFITFDLEGPCHSHFRTSVGSIFGDGWIPVRCYFS